jgi:hypothetical protein
MFSYSFPPVDDFISFMKSQDWISHYHRFMNFMITMCAFVVVFYEVLLNTWKQNNCTDRCIHGWNLVKEIAIEIWKVLHVGYTYTRQTLIPQVINLYSIFKVITSRQFVFL